MKLAILVVYLVSDDNKELLNIHLEQIEKHTISPYKIYASVNLLDKKQKEYLSRHPQINICDCPQYEGPLDRDRALYEHSYYLDNLVNRALEDEVTHIVIMHPDSFPIKSHWESILTEYLIENNRIVSLKYSPTACMFFESEFAKKYKPTSVPSRKTQQDKKFITFLKEQNLFLESGIGYKYSGYIEGFNWYELKRTNKGNDHYHFGSIYGDLIFHLGAAEHNDRSFPEQKEFNLFYILKGIFGKIIPQFIKNWRIQFLPVSSVSLKSKTRQVMFDNVRNKLYANPDNYIHFLRTGLRK
ncbi:hypothetical protein ACFL3O_00670 [Candidatus Neomarinimicrobiota bacterium]